MRLAIFIGLVFVARAIRPDMDFPIGGYALAIWFLFFDICSLGKRNTLTKI